MSQISPLSEMERRQLALFVGAIEDLKNSRFVREATRKPISIRATRLTEGEDLQVTDHPDFDWEDFRSFLTMFRRVVLLVDDPIYLFKVRNIVARLQRENQIISQNLRTLKREVNERLDRNRTRVMVNISLDNGTSFEGNAWQIVDVLINGLIFHGDEKHAKEVEVLLKVDPWNYLIVVYVELIHPILCACIGLSTLIQDLKLI